MALPGRAKKHRSALLIFVSGCCLFIFFHGFDAIFNVLSIPAWPYSTRNATCNKKPPFDVKFSTNHSEVGNGQFYIFSTIAEYTPQSSNSWSSVVLNGWETRKALKNKYKCCYIYADGSYKSTLSGQKRSWKHNEPLNARQVVCNISDMNVPELVSLVLPDESCNKGTYQAPLYRIPYTEPKFAICAKISYGQKNPVELVEWMEYHLLLGISKVVIYPYEDLNEKAWDVLKHYAKTGILEIVPLPYVPQLDKFWRSFPSSSKPNKMIMWQDEQVIDFDAQERLKQYKYYTLMDTDEFITQKGEKQRPLVQLMEFLLSTQTKVASFTMYSEIHLVDWAKTNNNSKLKIGQYGRHTKPMKLEPKLLHVTERLQPGSVWIHTSEPLAGFVKGDADPSIVTLKHFRTCKDAWLNVMGKKGKMPCHDQFQMFNDTLLKTVADCIEQKVLTVKRLLNLK